MITIEFYKDGSDDNVAIVSWPCAPSVGETVTLDRREYEVTSRAWGTHCYGDGTPLWDKPCMSISLKPTGQNADCGGTE